MKKVFLLMGMAATMFAFAGCQKNEQEAPVNPNESGSTFEFVAEIAQTKTTLDADTYKVEWEAEDVIYMVTAGEDTPWATAAEFTYADGKFNTETELAAGNYTMNALYAASSQAQYHKNTGTTHKLQSVQTQDCENRTAHIKDNDALVGTFTATVPMAEVASVNMNHIYTLMQVDVKNNTGAEINITKFEMTVPGADLAGIFTVDFETAGVETASGAAETITVNVENGTVAAGGSLPVYFVAAPFTSDAEKGVEFKVTTESGATYTKTAKVALTFNAGEYNTTPYTISQADEVPADVYGLVEVDGAFEDGAKYVLAFKDGKDGTFAFINSKGTSGTAVKNALEVTSGTIVNPSSDYVFTAVKSGDGFNFKNSADKYIYNNGTNTTLNTNNATATVWIPTFLTASSTYKLVATRYIAFNGTDKAMGYATGNFKDQVAKGDALAQYAGAISVFKLNYIPVVTPKILVAETNVTALADSEYVEIPYSTENVSGIITAAVTSDVDGMVSDDPVVESEKVIVYLNANETDKEKNATITLSYDGAEDVVISIAQYAAASVDSGLVSLYENITSTDQDAPNEFVLSVTDAIVTYVSGSAAFIEDQTAGMLIYMSSHGLTAGDVLNGTLTGKAYLRYGVCQISDFAFIGEKTKDVVPVTTITVADLIANYDSYISRRIKIENATVTDAVAGTSDKNGSVSQNGTSVNLYNNGSSVLFIKDDVVDFIAYPSYYNGTKQLATYEAPVSKKVNAPSISCSNNEVTITCTTVGATIYFAVDEDIYSVYTEPFPIDEDCTVKAYATKDGLIDSEVITEDLTWVDPNAGEVTKKYVKVTAAPTDWSGEYLLVYESQKYVFNGSLTTVDSKPNYITLNSLPESFDYDEYSQYAVTISVNSTGYSIKTASGYYIGRDSDTNGFNTSTSTKYVNTITLSNDKVVITGKGGRAFNYNSSSGKFRYFAASNSPLVSIYKLQ